MIPKFLRPEVWPFTAIEIVERLTDTAPSTVLVVCAWCPGFVRGTQPAGSTTGICQACSDLMIFEAVHRAERLQDELELERDPRDEDQGAQCSRACGYCGRCS